MEIIKLRKLEGLAARRKAAGYTQETFAEALGVQRGALSMWETLRAFPSAGILPAIADLLLCTVDDLYKAPEIADCLGAGAPRNDSVEPEDTRAAESVGPYGEGRRAAGSRPYEDSIPDREGV